MSLLTSGLFENSFCFFWNPTSRLDFSIQLINHEKLQQKITKMMPLKRRLWDYCILSFPSENSEEDHPLTLKCRLDVLVLAVGGYPTQSVH
jgi:hypothetical protein